MFSVSSVERIPWKMHSISYTMSPTKLRWSEDEDSCVTASSFIICETKSVGIGYGDAVFTCI